jgi:NAD-dependent DNA ligase
MMLLILEEWEKKRDSLDYQIDGIVVKVDEHNYQRAWATPVKHRALALLLNLPLSK